MKKLHIFLVFIYLLFICISQYRSIFFEVGFSGYLSRFLAFMSYIVNKNVSSINEINMIPLFNQYIPTQIVASIKNLGITESYFPFFILLFDMLNKVSSIPVLNLGKLALGSIIIPLGFIIFAKKIIEKNNDVFYYLLTIYFIIYFGSLEVSAVFYTSVVSFFLFFLILSLFIDIYSKHKNKNYVVIFLLFFSLINYWHTLSLFLYFLLFSFFVINILYNYKKAQFKKIYSNFTFILFFTVILFTFIHIWNSSYQKIFINTININDLLSILINKLFSGDVFDFVHKYNFRSSLYGNLYFYQIIIIYFISLMLYIFAIIKNIKIKIINISSLFLISLIFAQIIEIIAYYPSGSISFFYVPYIFPAFSISMLTLKNKKAILKDNFWKFLKIVLIIMSIVSCIIFWSMINTYDAGNTKLTKFENSKSSFHYLINYYDDSTVITDFSLLHKYLIRESYNKNYIINYLLLTADDYNNILTIYNFGEKNNATIILDYMSMKYNIPIDIRGSRGFQLIPYINNINNNQNCIYLDGSVIIYK